MPGPTAILCAHSEASGLTLNELALIPTPARTRTWRPVPHIDVVSAVIHAAEAQGFVVDQSKVQVAVNKTGTHLFGVMDVNRPDFDAMSSGFGMAVGFRNSHDKTMAVRLSFGTRVFVCDNMAMTGDVIVRRVHRSCASLADTASMAIDAFTHGALGEIDWFSSLKEFKIDRDQAKAYLLDAAADGALPLPKLLPSLKNYLTALTGSYMPRIDHPGTLWAAYQAVTSTWKGYSIMYLRARSISLRRLTGRVIGETGVRGVEF